jgi:hypothetical protein
MVTKQVVRNNEYFSIDCKMLMQSIDQGAAIIDKIEIIERGTLKQIHYILKF